MECEKCENWFHARILMINFKYKMKDMAWYCSNCQRINKLDSEPKTERKLLLNYVDDIICTVNGEPDTLLRKINILREKLEFTMEKPDENCNLAFLGMNIMVNSCEEINWVWYKKSTDMGVVLNFRSCATIQHQKNL